MLTLKTYQHGDTAYIDTNGIRVSGIVFKTETMLAIRPVPALVMTQEQLEGNWWNIMLKKYIKKELFLCHFDFYEEGLMSTASQNCPCGKDNATSCKVGKKEIDKIMLVDIFDIGLFYEICKGDTVEQFTGIIIPRKYSGFVISVGYIGISRQYIYCAPNGYVDKENAKHIAITRLVLTEKINKYFIKWL